ncbi:MAG: C69 family dipeptidase [Bacteroidaceae bacterium]|nr:C69 family dipeptidase [Bacteroidaceae bacterium]
MKKTILFVIAAVVGMQIGMACTNIIVGKKASKDGSVFVSYNADSYGAYGVMQHFPAGTHPKGAKRKVFDWESNKLWGEIDEAPVTYNVVGNMNEHQVVITETTFGGREEMVDSTGIIDYGSLIYITLQRAKTAREAIKIMDELTQKYGYNSEGETFSVADPNEAFILEMVGRGPGGHGALWVAVRVPDDAVCVHANQSRIHKFMQLPKDQVLYSKDIIAVARKMKLFDGKDIDFDFANTFCPIDFGGARYCEARVWAIYNMYAKGMDKYFDYSAGIDLTGEPLPLYIKPDRKIGMEDVMAGMRDHFDGTVLEMTNDPGAGAWLTPYRPRPLSWEYDGKKYFNERPVGTQQTSFAMIAQVRSSLPNPIGGILWFSNDDAHTTPYTPVYCCATEVPACYTLKTGNAVKFSFKSAFWLQNWVSNMVYPRYSQMFPDLKKVRDELDSTFAASQKAVEGSAMILYKEDPAKAVSFLTLYSKESAQKMMDRWMELGQYLIVKYNDMAEHVDNPAGGFQVSSHGTDTIMAKLRASGYDDAVKKKIIDQTGDRFLLK